MNTQVYDPDYYKFTASDGFVYVVESEERYEMADQVAVFSAEKEAVEFCLLLNHVATLAPPCPSVDDSDELWAEFYAKKKDFADMHPLGKDKVEHGYLNQTYRYFKMPMWSMKEASK